MERRVLVVCFIVGFLGILASVLGFAAEAKRIKGSQVQFSAPGICTYPRSPALGLGLTASVALMIAQAIINVAAGCICCKRNRHPPKSSWTVALVCFIFSWFTFGIAFLLLLTGAALNDQHGHGSMYFGNYCYVVKPGVFAGGALLSLASATLGILYYVTLSSVKSHDPNHGIAMSQPQFQPPSAQPVFVPEDTYIRQQYP
ncbi:hypothetical protein AQUCO_10500017v1 [Aquilegia coerulea]|uniref:Uncharacterized protein n=1 Tax=Aquilegia coerulea TaxID=218851 RepID=A0A2G5C3L4_AQUCA|nr:hypothetical protein AQUCO_10500017v1 [Aquilegia coerulea]